MAFNDSTLEELQKMQELIDKLPVDAPGDPIEFAEHWMSLENTGSTKDFIKWLEWVIQHEG